MRIADKMQFEQVKTNIAKNRSQMSELQNQAATQKRVTKPSDDPMAAARVLSNRSDLVSNKQFLSSLSYARNYLEFTDQSLTELSDLLVRAKELAISQSSDASASMNSRRAVAMEVEQLRNQIVAIGNRKIGDRFIFGGFHTQNAPFDPEGIYLGDEGEMMVHVDKESFVPMNVPGGRIFLGEGVGSDGMVKSGEPQAKTIEEIELRRSRPKFQENPELKGPGENETTELRGPASLPQVEEEVSGGVNIFKVMKQLSTALQTNDKAAVQNTLEQVDAALQQVILTRAQVGSRSNVIDSFTQTMEKEKVLTKMGMSNLEDADIYTTVSDINKAQATLQATLETSGKLVQPSLMSFLR